MTFAAATICSGVTLTSWPKAIEALVTGPHRSAARRIPRLSAGSSTPVGSPKPKALT